MLPHFAADDMETEESEAPAAPQLPVPGGPLGQGWGQLPPENQPGHVWGSGNVLEHEDQAPGVGEEGW